MNDSEFDDLLKMARGSDPLPASFRQGVWHRIEIVAQESPRSPRWFQTVVSALLRPWGAAAGVAAAVTLGLWLGAASLPDRKDPRVVYAESISPFVHPQRK